MEINLEIGLEFVFKWEGGYTNDPDDPGGATKWGIALNRIGRTLGMRKKDIVGLTIQDAEKIYIRNYWEASRCDLIPTGLDVAMFDCSVNQGPTRAKKLLQKALHVKMDGLIGPNTIASMTDRSDDPTLLRDFMVYRALHYSGLAKFVKYGLGWFRRLFDCHAVALSLIHTHTP